MEYWETLEEMLGVERTASELACAYDTLRYPGFDESGDPLYVLRGIKRFLGREKEVKRGIVAGGPLETEDCTTLCATANILAGRHGVNTRIVRPKHPTRFFHTMLGYESNGTASVFVVAGSRKYDYVPLSPRSVVRRMQYMRPLIVLANSMKERMGRNGRY